MAAPPAPPESRAPLAGSGALQLGQLREQGRWRPWGNGVRIDYANGWTDALLIGPAGAQQ
jgi:hypothetical protein